MCLQCRGATPQDYRILPRRIILVRHAESEGNIDNFAYTYVPDPQVPLVRSLLLMLLPVLLLLFMPGPVEPQGSQHYALGCDADAVEVKAAVSRTAHMHLSHCTQAPRVICVCPGSWQTFLWLRPTFAWTPQAPLSTCTH